MAINIGHGETVIRHAWSAGPKDRYGKVTDVWTDEEVPGVGVDVPNVDESAGGTDQQQTIAATIFLPAGMVCGQKDEFTVRGLRYKVNGAAPIAVKNFFTGAVFPTPVKLERVTG